MHQTCLISDLPFLNDLKSLALNSFLFPCLLSLFRVENKHGFLGWFGIQEHQNSATPTREYSFLQRSIFHFLVLQNVIRHAFFFSIGKGGTRRERSRERESDKEKCRNTLLALVNGVNFRSTPCEFYFVFWDWKILTDVNTTLLPFVAHILAFSLGKSTF